LYAGRPDFTTRSMTALAWGSRAFTWHLLRSS
jgi:hypothetical protein